MSRAMVYCVNVWLHMGASLNAWRADPARVILLPNSPTTPKEPERCSLPDCPSHCFWSALKRACWGAETARTRPGRSLREALPNPEDDQGSRRRRSQENPGGGAFSLSEGRSSDGRAAVSKTACRRFESCRPAFERECRCSPMAEAPDRGSGWCRFESCHRHGAAWPNRQRRELKPRMVRVRVPLRVRSEEVMSRPV